MIVQQSRPVQVVQTRATSSVVQTRTDRPVVQAAVSRPVVIERRPQAPVIATRPRPALYLAGGNQGPPGRDGAAGNSLVQTATYSAPLIRGQVVYLEDEVAYPVTRSMLPSVLALLAMVLTPGAANAVLEVLVAGRFSGGISPLLAGRVFLGDDGFPTSADNENACYVPIGQTDGGADFYFQPQQRFFR